LIAGWGNTGCTILPRSAIKMMQALPLVESGAADAAGLSEKQLRWPAPRTRGKRSIPTGDDLAVGMGLGEGDLRCGSHIPYDEEAANAMIRADQIPDQRHNNCSGKHTWDS
jgi:L-asparaginase II